MVDPVQIILLVVIIVLTLLLLVLGVQIFFILQEVKVTVKKTNKILDNANSITEHIDGPISALSSLALGVKAGSFISVMNIIKSFVGRGKEENKDRD